MTPPNAATSPDHLPHVFAEALNTRNLDLVDTFISGESYINHNPGVEDGRENAKQGLAGLLEAFQDLKVTIGEVLVAGDLVAARVSYEGTQTGEFFGIEPTGQRFQMASVDAWRLKDGRAIEHWDNVGADFLQST